MKRRILSLLLAAVILFTAFAFKAPISVSAAEHNPANGHYIYEAWGASGVVTSPQGTSIIGTGPNAIESYYYDGNHDARALRLQTNGTAPYISFSANNGYAGVDLSGKTHVAVTFYYRHYGSPVIDNNYLRLYIETASGEIAYSDAYYFVSGGEDWLRAVFDLSAFHEYRPYEGRMWAKNGNLQYFRLDIGNQPNAVYHIDSVFFTTSLNEAYNLSYDRGHKYDHNGNYIAHHADRIVKVDYYRTFFQTNIDPNLVGLPGNAIVTSPGTYQWVTPRFSADINYGIVDKGYSAQYEFDHWEVCRNIGFYTGDPPILGAASVLPGQSGTYNLNVLDTLNIDQRKDMFIEVYLKAVFRTKFSTVYWLNGDGTTLETDYEVPNGTIAEYNGVTPTFPSDAQYDYTFSGRWSPDPNEGVHGDVAYWPVFTPTLRKYTVTFQNWDNTPLQSSSVEYGATPVYTGAEPAKAGNAQYSYVFAGWDKELSPVTGEATYTATYTPIINNYTITWLNWDGSSLGTTTVEYGQIPTAPVEPTRSATAEYTYTFNGWSPTITTVTGEATYTAKFSETVNRYTVVFENHDGEVLQSSEVEYGTIPSYVGEIPQKEQTVDKVFSFTGWSPDLTAVTGEATYTAVFAEETRKYTVSFVNWDDSVLESISVPYGEMPEYTGEMPVKPETESEIFTFVGWDHAIAEVVGDATYKATFSASTKADSDIVTGKHISYDEESGQYMLQLEGYVSGSATVSTVTTYKPTDFVLSIDISHSMPDCINCGASDVDATSTGLHKAVSKCEVAAEDLDTSKVYYRSETETKPTYYCESCDRWYDTQHTADSHGGTYFQPKYGNGATYVRKFYTQLANENCGDSCSHSNWKHPIYAHQLDTSETYSKYNGDGVRGEVAYCDDCGLWYTGTNTTHVDGGTHESSIFIPARSADDTEKNATVFRKSCVSRMQAAKEALVAFCEQVKEMSKGPDKIYGTEDDVRHRVAIIGFGGDDKTEAKVGVDDYQTIKGVGKDTYTSTGIYSLYEPKMNEGFGYYDVTASHNNFESYRSIIDDAALAESCYTNALRDVSSEVEYEVLMEGVRELNYNYGTYINFAAVMAEQIFEHTYSDDERDGVDRSRVAVFFTDGKPDGDGEGLYDLADETLQPAYRMKNNEKGEVSIYSVGVFESADASKIWHLQDDNTAPNEFMHMLSSNFPTAYAFESAREVRDVGATSNRNIVITDVNSELLVTDGDGNVSVDPSKSGYYLTAINALELVNVFESISSDVSSGGASVTLDAETIVRDVISGNWEIDVDEDEIASEQINVYTMQYVAEDAWEATADRLTPVVFGNTVSVTGFDFSENYVGVDIIQGVSTYRGKKLVIEIPIRPTEDNMGGLRQPTNVAALSGIYYDSNGDGVLSNNERLETFAVPAVDIPTTVAISKIIENGDGFAGDNEFSLIGSYYNATFAYTSLNGELGGGNYLNMNKTDAEDFTLSLSEGENHSLENVMVGEILKIKEINAEDYQVKVEININPNNDEIEGDQEPEGERWYELAADADGYYNVTVEAGLKIRVTNTLLRANLTITKEGADPNDENQIFLFRVSGPNITMDIAIVGNDSVTIEHLPVGEYTVQELIYWSWRYDVYSVTATNDETVTDVENGIKFDLTVNDESVTFSNTRTNIYWLSGDSYVENWWIGDNDIIVTKRKESD